jgi:hypothetical protein
MNDELNIKDRMVTRTIFSSWCLRGSDGKFHHEQCKTKECECVCHRDNESDEVKQK